MTCSPDQLYHAYRQKIESYILSRVQDTELAKDLIQETFFKMLEHCQKGGHCHYPKSYIFRIAQNTLFDHFNRKVIVENTHENSWPDVLSDEKIPECIIALLDRVPDPYREAVILADLEHVPQKSLAEKWNLTLSGAKSRIQRGRQKFKQIIQEACYIEHDCYGNIIGCEPK